MKNIWKSIAVVVPAPALLWVGEWLDIFSETPLALPDWQKDATSTALGIGAFAAIFIGLYFHKTPNFFLRKRTGELFILTMFLIGTCLFIHWYLGDRMQTDVILRWQSAWRLIYTTAMVAMIATVSLGGLSIREENSTSILKPIIIVVLVTLALIAAFLLGRHVH